MTDEQSFDAREFASMCLSNAVDAIDAAHAYLPVMDMSDESLSQFSPRASDPAVEEKMIQEMSHGFIGREIYLGLFEDPDVQKTETLGDNDATMCLLISRLNVLVERYDPQHPRWKVEDYANYDEFWTDFNEDFGWPEHLAEKIVALDAPDFVSGVYEQLRDIADNPEEE